MDLKVIEKIVEIIERIGFPIFLSLVLLYIVFVKLSKMADLIQKLIEKDGGKK